MKEQDVLHHLLSIESEAVTLTHDAQIEVERRSVEYERQNHTHYDERYSHEVTILDDLFEKEIMAIKQEYQKQLEEYRSVLDKMAVDMQSFSGKAEQFLFGEEG
ncbi:MAG: hypothetical protein LBB43_00035 [Spirochaetaceae bacterium]|jgi:hypothetical protein|nr:hypothetical protein [Spirochaetaceae bacterium]